MEKKIIIIGAGVAGLAAGCYAQMNGYRSKIFELHSLPGGLCTAWERKDYIFDGCIHYLYGSGAGQPYYRLWEELGAIQDRKIIHHEEVLRVRSADGCELIAYADPDRLEAHMLELSRQDAGLIRSMCNGIRQLMTFDMSLMQQKPRSLWSGLDWADVGRKMLPYMIPMAQWAMISAKDFAQKFRDPFLRKAVAQMFTWQDAPMMVGLTLLASVHNKNAGFPVGASLEFARSIEKRYLELGGEIVYRAPVEKILVENDKAVGVRLYNDEVHRADYVISAADGRGTIFDMLDGKYINEAIRRTYDGHLPIHSQVQVSLGVNRDLSADPHWVVHLLDEPLLIGGEEHTSLHIKNYCFDSTLAPKGKSALVAMLVTHYHYWQRIYGHRFYDTEQTQVSDILIDYLEREYPGLRGQIEVRDEATPLSYERYTGNWQGSSCGWLLTPKTMLMMIRGMAKTLPGLRNLYLAGQWVEPGGGLMACGMSGKNAIQLICHEDDIPFRTMIP